MIVKTTWHAPFAWMQRLRGAGIPLVPVDGVGECRTGVRA
jgi:hypothetical protein